MSGYWEIDAAVSPVSILADGAWQRLVRVQITNLEDPDPLAAAFIDLPCPQTRQVVSEILAAADDTGWQTDQDGREKQAR